MRLLTLIAALAISFVSLAQDEPTQEDKRAGLRKISSNKSTIHMDADDFDLSALSNLANLQALQGLEALEGLEQLQSLESLESLEALEGLEELEFDLSGLEALEDIQMEVLEELDIPGIIEMSIDVTTDVIKDLELEESRKKPRK